MAKLEIPINIDWNDIRKALEERDIVEVVRCKYCKHHDGKDGKCPVQSTGDPFYDYKPDDNWYCGDGERSEDDQPG